MHAMRVDELRAGERSPAEGAGRVPVSEAPVPGMRGDLDVVSGRPDTGGDPDAGGVSGDPALAFFEEDARRQGIPFHDPQAPIDYCRKYGILPPNARNRARKHEVQSERWELMRAPEERV